MPDLSAVKLFIHFRKGCYIRTEGYTVEIVIIFIFTKANKCVNRLMLILCLSVFLCLSLSLFICLSISVFLSDCSQLWDVVNRTNAL